MMRTIRPKQEAQLMLTDPRDAFKGHSRSPTEHIIYVRATIYSLNCHEGAMLSTICSVKQRKYSDVCRTDWVVVCLLESGYKLEETARSSRENMNLSDSR